MHGAPIRFGKKSGRMAGRRILESTVPVSVDSQSVRSLLTGDGGGDWEQ